MHPAGFEPGIPASERPQTNNLDCAATGVSVSTLLVLIELQLLCVLHNRIWLIGSSIWGSGGDCPLILKLDTKWNVETWTMVITPTFLPSSTAEPCSQQSISTFCCVHIWTLQYNKKHILLLCKLNLACSIYSNISHIWLFERPLCGSGLWINRTAYGLLTSKRKWINVHRWGFLTLHSFILPLLRSTY